MMLLNGGVLGLLRCELPGGLQVAGDRWRIAILIVTCGMVLFISQQLFAPWWSRPLANALLTLGLTLFGRALRSFYDHPDRGWMLLPTVLTFLGVFWFDSIVPSLLGRITVSTLCWLIIMLDTAHLLWLRRDDGSISRRLMLVIYLVVAAFAAVRLVWLHLLGSVASSPLDSSFLVNLLSPLVMGILPVMGTTVFLLMCSDHIRREWERAAATDYLTGLPNRRTLVSTASRAFEAARADGTPLSLAMLDLDYFKQVNDAHGHDIGDETLCHVAQIMVRTVPTDHLVARVGGEEFVIVLPGAGEQTAQQLIEHLRARLHQAPLNVGGNAIEVTLSIGLTSHDRTDRTLDDLLRRADAALYEAKNAGRNRLVVVRPEGVAAEPAAADRA